MLCNQIQMHLLHDSIWLECCSSAPDWMCAVLEEEGTLSFVVLCDARIPLNMGNSDLLAAAAVVLHCSPFRPHDALLTCASLQLNLKSIYRGALCFVKRNTQPCVGAEVVHMVMLLAHLHVSTLAKAVKYQ